MSCSFQAMLQGFLAENSLPFSMPPKLMDCEKGLVKVSKVLGHLSMDRITASYKVQNGRDGDTWATENTTVEKLKSEKFLLNIDESTSTNFHRVLTFLLSHFDPVKSVVWSNT